MSRNVSSKICFENSVVHSCIFSYQVKTFNRCYDKLFTIKWFELFFIKTLRAIFKGIVVQIEIALLNDCLSVSKVS